MLRQRYSHRTSAVSGLYRVCTRFVCFNIPFLSFYLYRPFFDPSCAGLDASFQSNAVNIRTYTSFTGYYSEAATCSPSKSRFIH